MKILIKWFVALAVVGGALLVVVAINSGGSPSKNRSNRAPVVNDSVEKPISASLTETGSSLLYPLWNIWAPAYQSEFPQVSLTTGSTGSGTGIADAASGTVNIGSSDAYLSSTQLKSTPNLLNIPLAISYQIIEYNIPGVTAHLKLNGTILSKIYQGQITNWNNSAIGALNPGVKLPNLGIVALHRSDGSGDTFIFSQYLTNSNRTWASKYNFGTTISWPTISNQLGENGNGGMVSGCKATVGCIAYVGVSYLTSVLADGQTYAQLQNGVGQYEMPTATAVAAEAAGFTAKTPANGAISMIDGKVKGGYPIVNYEYAIVNKDQSSAATATAVRSLLEWTVDPSYGDSSQYLGQVFFQPLPVKIVTQSYKQIKSIK